MLVKFAGRADKLDKEFQQVADSDDDELWRRFAEAVRSHVPRHDAAALGDPASNRALARQRRQMADLLDHLKSRCEADAAAAGTSFAAQYRAIAQAYGSAALLWR
jgi:hypothetical protein